MQINPETGGASWILPWPSPVENRLRAAGTSRRELLEDVEFELRVWMAKTAYETGMANPCAIETWLNADHDIERVFAVQECKLKVVVFASTGG